MIGLVLALFGGLALAFLLRDDDAPIRPAELSVSTRCGAEPPAGSISVEARLSITWRSRSDEAGARGIGVSAPTAWFGPVPPWSPMDELNNTTQPPVDTPAGAAAEAWAEERLRAVGITDFEDDTRSSALDWVGYGMFVLGPRDGTVTGSVWTFGLVDRLSERLEPGTKVPIEVAFFDVDGSSIVRSLELTCT